MYLHRGGFIPGKSEGKILLPSALDFSSFQRGIGPAMPHKCIVVSPSWLPPAVPIPSHPIINTVSQKPRFHATSGRKAGINFCGSAATTILFVNCPIVVLYVIVHCEGLHDCPCQKKYSHKPIFITDLCFGYKNCSPFALMRSSTICKSDWHWDKSNNLLFPKVGKNLRVVTNALW